MTNVMHLSYISSYVAEDVYLIILLKVEKQLFNNLGKLYKSVLLQEILQCDWVY